MTSMLMADESRPRNVWARIRFGVFVAIAAGFYAVCLSISQVSIGKLADGLPRLAHWAARGWPPDFSGLDDILLRAAETVAIATVGTSFGALIAVPLCLLAARNFSPAPWIFYPARWLLNALRGIDSFVFALIFVAAVGLGPFAGVLGVMLHTAGSMAKLWSETIEGAERGPIEAATMGGAGRLKIVMFTLLPDVRPALSSVTLYMWEFNVRASTVLGVVGAGGIGQELKNSLDLLAFDRVFAILLIILAMVTLIDTISDWLRQRLI